LTADVQNVQQQSELLVKVIDQTATTKADELETRFLTFAETLITFIQDVRQVGFVSREFAAMPNIADKLADAVLKLDSAERVGSVDYIGLAQRLELAESADVIRQALTELSTYEAGQERLEWLRQALAEI
jgi:hypothetical protein